MINTEILQAKVAQYKAHFPVWWRAERYKWEAVQTFQKQWDIDAPSFVAMLTQSLSKTGNLLAASNYYARAQLQELASADPEAVRAMFRALYDESKDVVERIIAFKDSVVPLPGKHTFQDLHAITIYLWLRYPDKYYIFKSSEVKRVAKALEADYVFINGHDRDNLQHFYPLYDEICAFVCGDDEVQALFREKCTPSCYPDPQFRTLATDVAYFIAHPPKSPIASPLSTAHIWKISHGTNSTGVGDKLSKLLAARHVVAVDGATKALATSKITQGEMFTSQIKKGDYFYLCYGNSVQLLGQFTTDAVLPNAEKGGTWKEREYEVIAAATAAARYDGEKKWWTPNFDSTCVPISADEEPLFEALLLKPYFGLSLAELPHPSAAEGNYWWLVANPAIWHFSRAEEEESYTLLSESGHKRRIYQNFLDVRAGDKVIGYEATPTKQIVALCEMVAAQNGEDIKFRTTELLTTPIDYATLRGYPELSGMEFFVSPIGSLFRLTKDEYEFLIEVIRARNPLPTVKEKKPYTKDNFLREVFFSAERYDRLVRLLTDKKNIILQGAPGVGKTWAAKRLAYAMMGEVDDSRVAFVQFHQNYSYEDFIMGYKPSEEGFTLKKGKFYNFCTLAKEQPDKDFFFIIDEINRGNMSKIFGELLLLIENGYRGEPLTLAYDGLPFSVPTNLYIIGMMNTADRSLAMIDYALRRRFSFVEMGPAFSSAAFQQYQQSLSNTMFDNLIATIVDLNAVIAKDGALGKGFVIGHSYFCNWKKDECTQEKMRAVVDHDILPLLEEYWFDEPTKVEEWREKLLAAVG